MINKHTLLLFIIIFLLPFLLLKANGNDLQIKNNPALYDSLKHLIQDYDLGLDLHYFFLRNYSSSKNKHSNDRLKALEKYKGLIIKNIYYLNVGVFSDFQIDSLVLSKKEKRFFKNKKLQKLLSIFHISSSEFLLKRYLNFSIGDKIIPKKIIENEAIIRNKEFIADSRIMILPISNDKKSVAIILVTRDKWSYNFAGSQFSFNKRIFSLNNTNFLGLGDKIGIKYLSDVEINKSYIQEISYKFRYFSKDLFETALIFNKDSLNENYNASIYRELLSVYQNSIYGYSYNYRKINKSRDNEWIPKSNITHDIWYGRSIYKKNLLNLITSGRLIFSNKFEYLKDYYDKSSFSRKIISFDLLEKEYHQTYNLNNSGKTEDVPIGFKIDLTIGEENSFSDSKFYFHVSSENLKEYKDNYFGFKFLIGGYYNEQRVARISIDTGFQIISRLFKLNKLKFSGRISINSKYIAGFRRLAYENLDPNNNLRERLNYDKNRGKQLLYLSLENSLFPTYSKLGFRYCIYNYFDLLSLTSKVNSNELKNKTPLLALGIGIKIFNDFIIFKSINLRFSYILSDNRDLTSNFIILRGVDNKSNEYLKFTKPFFYEFR